MSAVGKVSLLIATTSLTARARHCSASLSSLSEVREYYKAGVKARRSAKPNFALVDHRSLRGSRRLLRQDKEHDTPQPHPTHPPPPSVPVGARVLCSNIP